MTRETAVAHQGAAAKLDAAAIAMYAVGGAAIAGGVVWAILDARSGRSVTVAPTGAGASMTVSFR
jgi:hypothetical protein